MALNETERTALGERLKALDAAIERLHQARAPFDAAIDVVDAVKEDLLEAHDAEIAGKCESCSAVLLVGELGHRCSDDIALCAECAPTWAELLEQYRRLSDDDFEEPDGRATAIAQIESRIAAGKGGEKHLARL